MGTLWVLTIALFILSLEISSVKGGCHDEKMDIAIMGDRSRSMNKWQRTTLINLLFKLIDKEGVSFSGNHFAIGTFGPSATIHNNFKDKFYYNNKNLKDSIQKKFSFEPKYWGTRTDLAMDRAVNVFTPQGGDRPNARNILLIFTDGKPFVAKNDKKPFIPYGKSRSALERKNVKIIMVGVGKNLWNETERMRMIVGKKGTVLLYRDFTKLSQSLDKVFEAICAIDGGYSEWSESKCSATCGGGTKTLKRTCTNPPPSNGGKDCSELGPAEKKVSCNEVKCRGCPDVSDIAILGDRSRSMNKEFRKAVIKLATDLVDKTGVSSSGNHFAIGTFGPSATIHNNFKNQVYHNGGKLKDDIKRKLSYIPAKWGTRIDLALDRAVKSLFSPLGGDRPEARNMMFIFTDAKPYIAQNDKKPFIPFTQSLQALKVKNVSIVVVVVGKEMKKAKTQFLTIVGKNGKVFQYDHLEKLSDGLDEILEAACE